MSNGVVFDFMGVVNLTPDSFSDGDGELNKEKVLEKCREHKEKGASVLDFGAESTAPFNAAISADEEMERFETLLFPILDDVLQLKKTISIDSYKPDVFKAVAQYIYSRDGQAKIIWNDVSGSLDQSLIETLEFFPNIHYVFSHNLAPKRSATSNHMEYVDAHLNVEPFFQIAQEELSFHQNLIFDPCFGFSKDADQNWELIRSMPDLCEKFNIPWLLGVSRKSFFKGLLGASDPISYREIPHAQVLSYWKENLPQGPYFIRLHDVALGHLVLKGQQNLT